MVATRHRAQGHGVKRVLESLEDLRLQDFAAWIGARGHVHVDQFVALRAAGEAIGTRRVAGLDQDFHPLYDQGREVRSLLAFYQLKQAL
jgi:hypothetical protein